MSSNQSRSLGLSFYRRRWAWVQAVIGATAIAVIVGTWIVSISDSPLKGDEWGTLDMGFNIATRGIFAQTNPDAASDLEFVPTNYREPLPPFLLACWLKLLSAVRGPLSYEFLKDGPGIRLAKLPNIFWGLILCASVFAALLAITDTYVMGVVGAVIVGLALDVDTLLTEPAAAALLGLTSFLCMRSIRSGQRKYYLFSGLSFGLLILTKAVFFYIGLALIGAVSSLLALQWFRGVEIKTRSTGSLIFVLGVAIIVGPWMVRNLYQFGSLHITQRSGVVLMLRAHYDQMNWTEFKGTFYVWAPNKQVQKLVGGFFGFNRADLKKGGRLQRLVETQSEFRSDDIAAEEAGMPEAAITYYFRARAERVKIARDLERIGHPNPQMATDTELRKRALDVILNNPVKHTIMVVPFIWRAALFIAPILILFTFLAVRWRRSDLVAYALPALAMVALHAVASHNEPRYNAPAGPIAVVCALFLVWQLVLWLGKNMPETRKRGQDSGEVSRSS